ncbi:transcriptional regulator [Alphaproteobacteria bacterium 46_93_T64]|nr:transcriptional regulator [Alphaproteobacteria bacterium 46_93_T64]
MDKNRYSITDLAEEFQVTSRTIRFYEDKGMVSPERDGLTRIYSRSDRARLKLILRGRRLGFSLQDIKKMIDLYDPEADSKEQLKFTLQKCEDQLGKLKSQRHDIDEAIDELETSISDLMTHLNDAANDGKKLA